MRIKPSDELKIEIGEKIDFKDAECTGVAALMDAPQERLNEEVDFEHPSCPKVPDERELINEIEIYKGLEAIISEEKQFYEYLAEVKQFIEKNPGFKKKKIFISHAWPFKKNDSFKDKWTERFVLKLHDYLEKVGLTVFLDKRDNLCTLPCIDFMNVGIDISDHILVICTRTMKYKFDCMQSGVRFEHDRYQRRKKEREARRKSERKSQDPNDRYIINERYIIPIGLCKEPNTPGYTFDPPQVSAYEEGKEGFLHVLHSLLNIFYDLNEELWSELGGKLKETPNFKYIRAYLDYISAKDHIPPDLKLPISSSIKISMDESEDKTESKSAMHDYLLQFYQNKSVSRLFSQDVLKIENVFVNLAIVDQELQRDKESRVLSSSEFKADTKDSISEHPLLFYTYEEIYSAKDNSIALDQLFGSSKETVPPQKLLVSGRAGMGKSTLCHQIAHRWAKNELWQEKFRWLFWIPLRNLADPSKYPHDKKWTFDDILDKEFFGESLDDFSKDEVYLLRKELLQQKDKVLWLLDGFDEISPLEIHLNPSMRKIVEGLLQQSQYLLVTSRPYAIPPVIFNRHVEIMGFTPENVDNYINNFFSAKESAEAKTCADNLKELLVNQPAIQISSRIPILLELICSIFKYEQEKFLDSRVNTLTVTSLYQHIVDQLMRRFLRVRGEAHVDTLSREQVLAHELSKLILGFLELLAYRGLQTPGIILNSKLITKVFNEICKSQRLDRKEQNVLFERILESGFLKPASPSSLCRNLLDNDYYFIHVTFQEFFAACYLIKSLRQSKVGADLKEHSVANVQYDIIQNKYQHRFALVLTFASGLLIENEESSDVLRLFWDCIEKGPHDVGRVAHFHLVLRCLEEARCDDRIPNIENYHQQLKGILDKFRHYQDEANYVRLCNTKDCTRCLDHRIAPLWKIMRPLLWQSPHIVRHFIIKDMMRVNATRSDLHPRDHHLLLHLGKVAATDEIIGKLCKSVINYRDRDIDSRLRALSSLQLIEAQTTKSGQKIIMPVLIKALEDFSTVDPNQPRFGSEYSGVSKYLLEITSILDSKMKLKIIGTIADIVLRAKDKTFSQAIFNESLARIRKHTRKGNFVEDLFYFVKILNSRKSTSGTTTLFDEKDLGLDQKEIIVQELKILSSNHRQYLNNEIQIRDFADRALAIILEEEDKRIDLPMAPAVKDNSFMKDINDALSMLRDSCKKKNVLAYGAERDALEKVLQLSAHLRSYHKKEVLTAISTMVIQHESEGFIGQILNSILNKIKYNVGPFSQELFYFVDGLNKHCVSLNKLISLDESDDPISISISKISLFRALEALFLNSEHYAGKKNLIKEFANKAINHLLLDISDAVDSSLSTEEKLLLSEKQKRMTQIKGLVHEAINDYLTDPHYRNAPSYSLIFETISESLNIIDVAKLQFTLDISDLELNKYSTYNLVNHARMICLLIDYLNGRCTPHLFKQLLLALQKSSHIQNIRALNMYMIVIKTLQNIPLDLVIDYYRRTQDPLCIEAISKLVVLKNMSITIVGANVKLTTAAINIECKMNSEHIKKLLSCLETQAKECGLIATEQASLMRGSENTIFAAIANDIQVNAKKRRREELPDKESKAEDAVKEKKVCVR